MCIYVWLGVCVCVGGGGVPAIFFINYYKWTYNIYYNYIPNISYNTELYIYWY